MNKLQEPVNKQPPQAPPAPPAPSAAPPSPDAKRSPEMEAAGADKTGFSSLIIPRTAFAPLAKNVPG